MWRASGLGELLSSCWSLQTWATGKEYCRGGMGLLMGCRDFTSIIMISFREEPKARK